MSQIKYVHVIEQDDGERTIVPGKGEQSGSWFTVPTPENDHDDFGRIEWERVDYWPLPDPMPKSAFVDWWNENKDDDVEPIPAVLDAMGRGDSE